MTETTDLERELRAALADAHADAPEPPGLADRLVAAATSGPSTPHRWRLRPSRRWLPPLAAAAAVLALVVGIDAVVTSLRDDGSRPASKNPGLTTPLIAPQSLLDVRKLGFHVAPVHFIVVSDSWGIDSDGQMTDATLDGREAGVKMLYQGKSLSPMTGRSKDVTVNGLPGTYTEAVAADGFEARLAWQYAPDSWAYVGAGYDGKPPPDLWQKYLTIAEAVRPGGKTLLLPVRFGAVPASLPAISHAERVDFFRDEGDVGGTMYVRVNDDVMVSATYAVAPDECLGFTYRGHRGCVGPNDGGGRKVGLHLGDVDVTYEFSPRPDPPLEDMKRLLADMTIAKSSSDFATWFDLRTALGG